MKSFAHARTGLVFVVMLSLIATACGGGTTAIDDPAESASAQGEAEPTTANEPEPTVAPAAEPEPSPEPEPTPPPAPTATPEPTVSFWSDGLEPGTCIIRLEGNPAFQPPNIVPCDEPHEEEVYALSTADFAATDPYPGEDNLADLVAIELCDAATIDFAGEPWDQLAMETYLLYPLEEEWAAGDRNIACSAGSHQFGGFKIGTAAGGTIDTDDTLIVRTSIISDGDTWEDFMVIREGATLDNAGSLSDGQFDLPPRRPFPVDRGFLFNAFPAGGDVSETVTWGYSWETGEFTDLGAVLPGQDIGGTMIANDRIVFSARESVDDDRDLYIAQDGEARVLVGGEGDQYLPTFTPDFESVIFHDRGDLWIIDVDGTNARQLTNAGDASDYESIVSPDGQTVVFASDRTGNDELFSVSIDGGEPVNLTNHPGADVWPVFSADGRYIYFSTDRLDADENGLRLMVMEADGSNQSWFTTMQAGQAMLVDERVADQVVDRSPTLDDRFNYDLVGGEPGTFFEFEHSSGRLTIALPAGWRIGENSDEPIGFIAAPRPSRYFDVWAADGVEVRLYDGDSEEEFFARYESSLAVTECEQFDGTGEVVPLEDNVLFLSGNFNCGSEGAGAGVLSFYNTDSGVGLIIEGQRDNLPDADLDSEMLTIIAQSVTWE